MGHSSSWETVTQLSFSRQFVSVLSKQHCLSIGTSLGSFIAWKKPATSSSKTMPMHVLSKSLVSLRVSAKLQNLNFELAHNLALTSSTPAQNSCGIFLLSSAIFLVSWRYMKYSGALQHALKIGTFPACRGARGGGSPAASLMLAAMTYTQKDMIWRRKPADALLSLSSGRSWLRPCLKSREGLSKIVPGDDTNWQVLSTISLHFVKWNLLSLWRTFAFTSQFDF